MSKTYRIRTEVGVDRQVNIEIDQDFEQLEILSLKVRSEEIYTRMCADYGVIVGRVVANGGYGVPNVRLSVFIPLTDDDANDEIISSLYPYRNVNTDVKNDAVYNYISNIYTQVLNQSYPLNFEISIYVLEINVLTILNGSAGLKFS